MVANLGDILSGGFAFVSIQVAVTASSGGTITNSAFVTSSTPDPNNANNSASVSTTVIAAPTPVGTPTPFDTSTPLPTSTPTPTPTPIQADLAVTKTASSGTVNSGSTLTYSVQVSNNGPAPANSVVLSDPLPAGTTFVSCTTSQGVCFGPAVGTNGTVSASLGTIPSPGFALVSIVVTVTAPGGSTITNSAVASSSTADPNFANNTGTVSTTVTAPVTGADLSIVKTASTGSVPSGNNFTYTLTVHNGGPDPAAGVTVTDALPGGTTFVSCTGPCVGPAVGTNGTVTFSFGAMGAGSSRPVGTVTIERLSRLARARRLTNTAAVTSSTSDPNPSNNSSTVTTSVTAAPSADLSLSKTASPNPVLTGNNLTYTIVMNNGRRTRGQCSAGERPAAAPDDLRLLYCRVHGASRRNQWDCPVGPRDSCQRRQRSTLSVIVVNVNAPGNSTITNTANVTSTTTDPNSSNNSASVTTTVNP